jgi:hypothetical protein
VLQHARLSAESDQPFIAAQRMLHPQFNFGGGRKAKLRSRPFGAAQRAAARPREGPSKRLACVAPRTPPTLPRPSDGRRHPFPALRGRRLTVLVMSLLPTARAYLLADGAAVLSPGGPAPGNSLLVINTHQQGAKVLTFGELRGLVDAATGSPEAYDAMWDAVQRQVAALLATAVPAVRAQRERLPGAAGGFEVLGVDVLLDQGLHPWIIEVRVFFDAEVPAWVRARVACSRPPGRPRRMGAAKMSGDYREPSVPKPFGTREHGYGLCTPPLPCWRGAMTRSSPLCPSLCPPGEQ